MNAVASFYFHLKPTLTTRFMKIIYSINHILYIRQTGGYVYIYTILG